ncbi:MAG: aromatic-ring-hydroxylating dioxygenase subunit beta [Alphaproteobacteria bacterium]|nr:aromatic-ring-hydroxylating dioxygenase subunit beta [Alphaproteobacteria bacterium]
MSTIVQPKIESFAAVSEASTAIADVSPETQRKVEQLLFRQAEILDDRAWDDWLALWTEDGAYWMPASPEQTSADGLPNIFFEDLYLMRTRIRRLDHPRAWSQSPRNRTSHVVSNVIIEHEDPGTGDILVRSKFFVAEYRLDAMRYFAGKYRHDLCNTDDGYRIRLQRVDLVNVEGPFDYVMQYWL